MRVTIRGIRTVSHRNNSKKKTVRAAAAAIWFLKVYSWLSLDREVAIMA